MLLNMFLHDSKIVTIDTQQQPYAISKGWINLSLYIHTLCGNVPNYSFPTADQLQLNCSNFEMKWTCHHSESLISISVDFYLNTICFYSSLIAKLK